MGKTLIVSNRMSTSVSRSDSGFTFTPSVGGLATGLSSLHEQEESLWIGWSGLPSDELTDEERATIAATLRDEHKSIAVDLSSDDLERFYYGFCNNTIWPLFHYFPTYVTYDDDSWESYREVNERFFERVKEFLEPDDIVWVHDYQLMLLPALIKEYQPDARVGFFLHIPFPSYEVFRLLPWRETLLLGLLGADLIGFHTYDYARHFLSSVRRLLGYDHDLASIRYENRLVRVDVFPMGIDYDRYAGASQFPAVKERIAEIAADRPAEKLILSVDRLDYTKGIPQRLRAYQRFLENYPRYLDRVSMVLIVAPSRTAVPQYQELKREVDELVSIINGRFSTISWTPIHYFYRTFPFEHLTALYAQADVLLVTALRDGMNLIAKEYIAAKGPSTGVIVVSETAGVARELSEAIIVNPSSVGDIADGLAAALEMPAEEQKKRNERMVERLRRYDIHYWAHDFIQKLGNAYEVQQSFLGKRLARSIRTSVIERCAAASRRLLLLDYDGTLLPYMDRPDQAVPDAPLKEVLSRLAADERNDVVLISSRGREFMSNHLGDLNVGLIASHGIWIRRAGEDWEQLVPVDSEWKDELAPVMQLHAHRTPGSQFEEKEYGLAWHYRGSEPDLAFVRVAELRDALLSMSSNHALTIFEGNRVLEVKSSLASKAQAAAIWYDAVEYDLILAAGDDQTDEELFASLPDDAQTVRIGLGTTNATYFLENPGELRMFLKEIADQG
ncbi:MAG: bifunctional alpha,alpha-trehalose-phosphate synthase (UDP-forming)/trehalose-phosphatase [Spirochaetota bacterium]